MTCKLSRIHRIAMSALAACGVALAPSAASGQAASVSLRDSIPIGGDGICEAQIQSPMPGDGLFDRSYLIVCRDAAAPVGSLHVLGDSSMDAAFADVAGGGQCREGELAEEVQGMSATRAYTCTAPDTGITRLVVVGENHNRTFAASGLSVYSDALRIGLASLATDRIVGGVVEVPLTQAGDAQAFARAQAEAISAEIALNEAYRRSNAGNFAEAAAFFAASASSLQGTSATEAQLNSALLQSNLGNYLEAARMFEEAEAESTGHPILSRLSRNFRALDALNRRELAEVLPILDQPQPDISSSIEATMQLQIDRALAERLSAEQGSAISRAGSQLTVLERAQLLDGQAEYLRAATLRQQGQVEAAQASLLSAQAQLAEVREGRVTSILWLRSQILTELAEIAEDRGDLPGAETLHLQAINVLESNYPGSPALLSARAQLAGLYARSGRTDEAISVYRTLVADADSKPPASLRRLFAPYFALLAAQPASDEVAADMFAASQLLLRPGLAQTQAVLARELSGGSDEAAQLFRQAINLNRAIEIARGEVAQARSAAESEIPGAASELAIAEQQLAQLQQRQLEVQQQLADYPRYRVVTDNRLDLESLQDVLEPGEAYFKMVTLDDAAYAIYIDPDMARAYRLAASPDEISGMVDTLRDSIAVDFGGQTITYPFEIDLARQLYLALFAPVDTQLRQVQHLVFEPDGAMLQLPLNLLVMDDASVERYQARMDADPDADAYDYRGTEWLGRAVQVSTAVSSAGFRDVRQAQQSNARNEYLGLGQNLPLGEAGFPSGTRAVSNTGSDRCYWQPSVWNNPIAATELRTADQIVASAGGGSAVLTDAAFTDTALLNMDELDEYRILHFATHGLVTGPARDCPPRPALLTSFGDGDSDGLLSFAEIFDLQLDADLVILSACNTASAGGLVASREAGISGSGNFALDGLVRAFVGAGGRTIVASHWPVPDDYDATERLISGFFQAGTGQPTTEALRQAQLELMDDVDTSHPFYWAAFAVVGDGAIPVRR